MGLLSYLQRRREFEADQNRQNSDKEYRQSLIKESQADRESRLTSDREQRQHELARLALVQAQIREAENRKAQSAMDAVSLLQSTFGRDYNFGAPISGPVIPDLNYGNEVGNPETRGRALLSLLGDRPIGETLPALAPRLQETGFGMNAMGDQERLRQQIQPSLDELKRNQLANENKRSLVENEYLHKPEYQKRIRETPLNVQEAQSVIQLSPGEFAFRQSQLGPNDFATGALQQQISEPTYVEYPNPDGGPPLKYPGQPKTTLKTPPGRINKDIPIEGNTLKQIFEGTLRETSQGINQDSLIGPGAPSASLTSPGGAISNFSLTAPGNFGTRSFSDPIPRASLVQPVRNYGTNGTSPTLDPGQPTSETLNSMGRTPDSQVGFDALYAEYKSLLNSGAGIFKDSRASQLQQQLTQMAVALGIPVPNDVLRPNIR